METTTYQEIQGLSRMTVGELREKYLDVFGEETRSYHKEYLRKRIAWRIQVLVEGDLTERARRRAGQLADDADLRIRTPRDPIKSGSAEVRASTSTSHIPPSSDPRSPLPGTLLDRFRHPNDPLKYLIVTSEFIAGFDAPLLQVMYLDKPMRDHNPLQAICQTNREYPNKTHGLIVDYLGIFDEKAVPKGSPTWKSRKKSCPAR